MPTYSSDLVKQSVDSNTKWLPRYLLGKLTKNWTPPETGSGTDADFVIPFRQWLGTEEAMAGRQAGFWYVEHRLRELTEHGDPLEKLGVA